MANNDFQAGDVVQLKSGGPKMTVVRKEEGDDRFYCEWFDAKGVRQGELFQPTSLMIADSGVYVA